MLPFLPEDLWAQMVPVFGKAWPNEAVIAIWPDEWRVLENVSRAPMLGFTLSEADRVELLTRKPLILLHSHPNGTKRPSDEDTESQLLWGFPWGVVSIDANPVTGHIYAIHYPEVWGAGLPIPALLGRSFLWGIRDCLTLAQDFYALNGVNLPRVPRAYDRTIYPKGHWGHDQFLSEPKRMGLKPIERHARRAGDINRWHYKEDRYSHCAIYLGEGRYLHQPNNQLSQIHTTDHEEKFIERMNVEFFRPKSMPKNVITDIALLEQVSPRPTSN